MTWSYSGDPSASSTDAVRFLIGDTDTNDQQLSNEEILWLVSQAGNATAAAIQACEGIAAKYARQTDKSAGELSVSASQKQKHYLALAKRLRGRAAIKGAIPYAGGISIADKDTVRDDDDRVRPAFTRTLREHPGTPSLEDDDEDYRWR